MPDCVRPAEALFMIRHLIADLEWRLEMATGERERQAITTVLRARRLEEADFLDQLQDPGDLP